MKTWALMILFATSALAEDGPLDSPRIVPDVVYGHKDGLALTYDVIKPAEQSGAAVILVQSGGWFSTYNDPKTHLAEAKMYLDRAMTVIVLRHGSAPKYTVPEAVADIRRAVRHMQMNAKDLGIDPDRIGITGGSAGGHLSVMAGTTGDDGDPEAKDEVLKYPSRVAAVVALCPPTDLRKWTTDPPAEIKKYPTLKPQLTFDEKLEPEVSPALKVTADDAPTLLIHGDKDVLVPIEHSEKMVPLFEEVKVPCKLVTVEGAGHSFTPQQRTDIIVPATIAWFDEYLKGRASPYWAATLLPCRGCGTAHAIEHSNEKPAVKDRLFHSGEPVLDDDGPDTWYEEDGSALVLKWYRGPPVLSNWAGGQDLTTDNIAEVACVHCGSNSLTDRWEENWPCPRCASAMKSLGFWVT